MNSRNRILRPDGEPSPAQVRFEEERVKMVLNAFGMADAKHELLDAHFAKTDQRRLTFDGFRRRFPTFPIILEARHVGRLGERVELVDLFRRPGGLFLTDLFLEMFARHEQDSSDRPVGLVIPFAGYRGGVVIHNGEFETGGNVFSYPLPGDVPPHRLKAEPFDQLLKYLAAAPWSPDGHGGDHLPVARPDPASVRMALAPWMTRRLGTGPGFVLFAWLVGLMNSPSAKHRPYIRRGENGVRYLAATYEELSEMTGMSHDTLKRGLEVLKVEKLLRTYPRERRTYLVLDLPDESEDEFMR